MSQLVIVGTVAFDAIETPFGKTDKILGGAATYIGLSAAQYHAKGALVSVVGGDFPAQYLELLESRGMDTLVTELNVLADFNPVVPENYRDSEVVLLGNLHPEVQSSVLDQMTAPKLVILDTMNFWMEHTWDALVKVMKRVDVISINDEEARELTGEYSLVRAAQKIQEMGPKYVIIKKGEHGALIFHKDEVFFAPALPLEEVFDPTGAGDTFAGGFAGFLAQTQDYSFDNMKKAIVHGSALASFCVEKFGTERLQNLTREELYRRLQQFKQLTQFDIELH
jgi:sugar/nucleoside kinase (ribokinase family)